MRVLYTLLFIISGLVLSAQNALNHWSDVAEASVSLEEKSEVQISAAHYRVLSLDLKEAANAFAAAPMEFTSAGKNSNLIIELPTPDGGWESFKVVESPVMEPALAARYPNIKTYKGYSQKNNLYAVRFDITPQGFHARMETPEGDVYIEPYATEQTQYYINYYLKDLQLENGLFGSLPCGYDPASLELPDFEEMDLPEQSTSSEEKNNGILNIREYRFALACTGEFGSTHGGTVETVLGTFNTAVNQLNGIFERETAVRMMLIEETEQFIFTAGSTDPFDNPNNGSGLLNQVQNFLNNTVGATAYDLGHIFTNGCTDVGGVANGTICGSNKGRGVTCHTSSLTAVVNGTLSHEIGHQFSGRHTWNNCPPTIEESPNQLHSESAMEPGSGSTILSYGGLCGNQNIVNVRDVYYHMVSLEQFIGFAREGNGSTCGTDITTDNNEPELTLPYEDGFYIPISTPFELTAQATDVDNDELTYCWEQHDTGPVRPIGDPFGNSPLFRSFPPTTQPTRVFPRLNKIINNQSDNTEVLPDYSRDMTFTCVVRDNNEEASAAVWKEIAFEATESAGPFLVMHPNESAIQWEVGEYTEVTWDVANTTNSLVKCQFVNIKLSLDGGFTYPITLANGTQNDGSEFVTVPDNVTTSARIRVEAANNIFFDISNANFEIIPPTEPGFAITPSTTYELVCLPDVSQITFTTDSLLGFANPITLDVVDGLPEGAEVSFSENPVTPTEETTLFIDFSGVNLTGIYELNLRAIAEDADTTFRTVLLDIISNDFSELEIIAPFVGQSDINLSTEFLWTPTDNADSYDFQLATSPAFGNTIIDAAEGLEGNSFIPTILLEENTLFFWRIRPVNRCGTGDWLEPSVFRTISVACAPAQATDTPINISGTGLPTIESTIFIQETGIISDVNIPNMVANYQPVNSLKVTLVSPAGTQVILFDENCGNTINLRIGFDDEAPSDIVCPPDDGIVFKPVEPLSSFAGEDISGTWTMRVAVVDFGFGASGALDSWNLEFCASVTPTAPALITNDTLPVPPGQSNPVTNTYLEVQDEDNTPPQLTYTVVTPPSNGALIYLGEEMEAGGQFTQATINVNNLFYLHDGSDTQFDSFTFTVEDNTGGWIPTQRFNIKIEEDAIVGTVEANILEEVSLFPNPTTGRLNIGFSKALNERLEVTLFNLQGQKVMTRIFDNVENITEMDAGNLSSGVYIVSLRTNDAITNKKITIQR